MNVIIATGGLDEMAIDVSYVVFFCLFVLMMGLIAFSWWKRSLIAAIIALIVVLIDGALIEPWTFIDSRPSDWPYDQSWQLIMRIISAIWLLSVFLAAITLVRAIRHRKII